MKDQFDELLAKRIEESFNQLQVPYNPSSWNQIRDEVAGLHPGYLRTLWKSGMFRAACIIFLVSLSGYFLLQQQSADTIDINLPGEITEPYQTEPQPPPELSAPAPGQPQSMLTEENTERADAVNEEQKRERVMKAAELKASSVNVSDSPGMALEGIRRKEVPVISVHHAVLEPVQVGFKVPGSKSVPVVNAGDIDGTGSKTGISVLASPTLNYSEAQTKGSAGFTAGIVSDYPLTKGIRISSGLVLARQNLRIEESGNTNLTPDSGVGAFSSSTTADLLTLDVPLNLQFTLGKRHNRESYVSVGVSSYLFLKEQFDLFSREVTEVLQEADDGSIERFPVVEENTEEESNPTFSTFDFAEVLNFAVGFNYSAGKKTDLVIEPFIKYPLGSLTSKNVQFGSGGINIRIRFR